MLDLFSVRRSVAKRELIDIADEIVCITLGVEHGSVFKIKGFIFPFIYVNKDNGNIVSLTGLHDMDKDIIEFRNKYVDEAIGNGNFERVLTMVDGQYAMLCYDLIHHLIPYDMRYELFIQAYRRTDFNFGNCAIDIDYYELLLTNRLCDCKRKHLLDNCADENGYVKVYRAQGSKSTDMDSAISWTTSLTVAKRFALEHNISSDGEVYKAMAHIDDISDFIKGSEDEIIINYQYLKDVSKLGGK